MINLLIFLTIILPNTNLQIDNILSDIDTIDGVQVAIDDKLFNDKYALKYKKNWDFRECIDLNIWEYRLHSKLYRVDYCKNTLNTQVELVFGWDLMLSRTIWYYNKINWYSSYASDIFKDYHPNEWLSDDVILFYNLESPFLEDDNDIYERTFIFASNPKNIDIIKSLAWNRQTMLSLANNHITNAGWLWIDTTIDILDKHDIWYVGIAKSGWNSHEAKYLIDKNGNKICFGAYTYDGWNKYLSTGKYPINSINLTNIKNDIINMDSIYCDMKIISLHWWAEYIASPTQANKSLAHNIIDSGADLIIWWHSHIFGEYEEYEDKMIYYSLWNYIFDQDWGMNGCLEGMDCIFDKKLGRYTTPTYIWTSIYHRYNISDDGIKLLDDEIEHFRIVDGRLKKY